MQLIRRFFKGEVSFFNSVPLAHLTKPVSRPLKFASPHGQAVFPDELVARRFNSFRPIVQRRQQFAVNQVAHVRGYENWRQIRMRFSYDEGVGYATKNQAHVVLCLHPAARGSCLGGRWYRGT